MTETIPALARATQQATAPDPAKLAPGVDPPAGGAEARAGAAAAPASAFADHEMGALAHRLYREGVGVAEIRARTGLTRWKVYSWIDKRVDERGRIVADPAPRKLARREGALAREQRERMMARMWDAAEVQLGEIESRLKTLDGAGADIEREARTLAILARVVRELNVQNLAAEKTRRLQDSAGERPGRVTATRRNASTETPDEQPARELGQLRDDLARHLARLRNEGGAARPDRAAQRG